MDYTLNSISTIVKDKDDDIELFLDDGTDLLCTRLEAAVSNKQNSTGGRRRRMAGFLSAEQTRANAVLHTCVRKVGVSGFASRSS